MQVSSSQRLKQSNDDFLAALTSPVLAATKSIETSSQVKKFSQELTEISSSSSSFINDVKDLTNSSYDLFKLDGNNSSYADAMKKTFEDGLVKVNGNWITLSNWWTSGWSEAFDSIKDGAASILNELNPFKSLSTAEWTVALLAYKRNIYEKYESLKSYDAEYWDSLFNDALSKGFENVLHTQSGFFSSMFQRLTTVLESYSSEKESVKNGDLAAKEEKSIGQFEKLNVEFGEKKASKVKNGEYVEETVSYKKDVNGTEFDKVMASGADFIPNHYTAAFYWGNLTTEVGKDKLWNASDDLVCDRSKFLTPAGLAVRMTKINVPQIKNEAFSVAGAFHEIKKLRSTKDVEHRSSFTLRLDSRLAWLKALGQLAGEDDFIESLGTSSDWRESASFIANSLSSYSNTLGDKRLMLAVMLNNLSPMWLKNGLEEDTNKFVWRVVLFDNVKIVGTDGLTYSNDGGIKETNVDFIYSGLRILKTDHYYNLKEISNFERE